jgi:putative radical SAM enzyme (TIGR03279 family)
VAAVEGAAERAGVRCGDGVLAVNGRPAVDVLDIEFAAGDGRFEVTVARGRRRLDLEVELRRGEGHGFRLQGGLGSKVRRCVCDCLFCFVDQVPEGLRADLSVKDDDYRLSFLSGTFITLANMDDADLERVLRLRLSPLYVSLHAWDDDVRVRLMGRRAADTRRKLQRLVAGGIEAHVQVVLCPGVNDGRRLRETLTQLAGLDGIADVGVVPVSLATERELRRVRPKDARAALAIVTDVQEEWRGRLGRRFAHAADELHLLAGAMPPPSDAAQQHENGVGLCAAFLDDVAGAGTLPKVPLALLGGALAEPVLAQACATLGERAGAGSRERPRARPYIVANRLFGPHVTVTGLLGGREVLARLDSDPLAADEWLLAPRSFLPEAQGVTLDDVAEADLRAGCGGRLAVGADLGGALAQVRPDSQPPAAPLLDCGSWHCPPRSRWSAARTSGSQRL